jgi:hypothetical protein
MVISQAYFFWRLHFCKLSLKKTTPQLQVSCKLGLEVKMRHTQHGYLISLLFLAFTFLQIVFKKTTPQLHQFTHQFLCNNWKFLNGYSQNFKLKSFYYFIIILGCYDSGYVPLIMVSSCTPCHEVEVDTILAPPFIKSNPNFYQFLTQVTACIKSTGTDVQP